MIRVPVGVFELAGSDALRLVAEEHVDVLPGRVTARGPGYAIVEWQAADGPRSPRPHSRRRSGAVE